MHRVDAVAPMGVPLIVIYVGLELGKRCIDGLIDSAPARLADRIQQLAEALRGVNECHQSQVRTSGAHGFVHLHATFSVAGWTMSTGRARHSKPQ